MTTRRTLTMSLLALAATGLLGCTQTSAAPEPSETASAHADAMHQMHGPPGPEMLLVAALHHLEVTPAQRAAIASALQSIPPVIDRAMFAEVAAAVRAANLDPTAVLAQIKGAAAKPERDAALASALDTLHSTLTAEQRRGLVDAVNEHFEEHGAMPAHEAGMMQHLAAAGVTLTAAQRDAVAKMVAAQPSSSEETKAQMEAFHHDLQARLETFAGATFDATAFVAFAHGMAAMQMAHISHMVDGVARLLPMLDATQREAVAQMIEKASVAQM
jgi:Spy/CpxP family protein refolding chaperone